MKRFNCLVAIIGLMAATGCRESELAAPVETEDTETEKAADTATSESLGSDTGAADRTKPTDTASTLPSTGADVKDTQSEMDKPSTGGDTEAEKGSGTGADSDPAKDTDSEDKGSESDTAEPGTDSQTEDEMLDAGDAADADDIDLGIFDEPVTLLVVFDKSGSMSDYWNGESKWVAASNALKQAVEVTIDRVTVGAILFPMPSGCEVEEITGDRQIFFMPGQEFLTEWESAAVDNGPDGSTPLYEAFQVADRAIDLAEQQGLLDQPLKVFVLTDGQPNCDYSSETITEYPEKWLGQGITTYVFGLPGSSTAVTVLDRIAEAGGTGEHISSDPGDTPDDLRDDVIVAI